MTTDQVRQLIAYMTEAWRVEFTEGQQAVWEETFDGRQPAHARAAIKALKEAADIVPSHAEFVRAYGEAKRVADLQHEELMIGKPGGTRCDCESGWVRVSDEEQGTVKRCPRCGPAQTSSAEHPKGCTCMTCHYGVEQADKIRSGDAWHEPQHQPTIEERDRTRVMLNEMRVKLGKPERDYDDAYERADVGPGF